MSFDTSICITQKPNCIGLYFSSLTYDNFMIFLKEMEFDEDLIENLTKIRNKISYLMFDVGFDVIIIGNNINYTKISFYGIF
jgi:hypothetical protein